MSAYVYIMIAYDIHVCNDKSKMLISLIVCDFLSVYRLHMHALTCVKHESLGRMYILPRLRDGRCRRTRRTLEPSLVKGTMEASSITGLVHREENYVLCCRCTIRANIFHRPVSFRHVRLL